jgi:hypothetical protein
MTERQEQLLVRATARAVAVRESFFAPPGRFPHVSQRMNNPVCLKHWKDRTGRAYDEINGYVVFPECQRLGCTHPDHPYEIGWRAARTHVKINVVKRELTFVELVGGRRGVYAGMANAAEKHSPVEYAQFLVEEVCRELGIESRCGDSACACATSARPRCSRTIIKTLGDAL